MTDAVAENVSQDVASSVDTQNSSISTTLVEYRTYGVVDAKGNFVGVDAKNPSVLSQTATGKNWEAAQKAGATALNTNQFKFYSLSDESALSTLVADPKQRLYIIQKGLDAIQTAAANRLQTELQEKKDKDEADQYMYNDETIDLREAINRPPEKKNLTPMEKFERALGVIPQDQLAAFMAELQSKIASGQAATS